jgi:hypothetical protein
MPGLATLLLCFRSIGSGIPCGLGELMGGSKLAAGAQVRSNGICHVNPLNSMRLISAEVSRIPVQKAVSPLIVRTEFVQV